MKYFLNIGINEVYLKYFKIFDMTIVAHMEEKRKHIRREILI